MLNYNDFIQKYLKKNIDKYGSLRVGINLNDFIKFEDANNYAKQLLPHDRDKITSDKARQEKSSKDSILGKLVEEIIVYLLLSYFKENNCNYFVATSREHDDIIKDIVNSLCIKRRNSDHIKHFDSDIIIYNKDNFINDKKVFIISAKGTTRERIGQFLSHLFLMDQDVLNAKYGKDKYTVKFIDLGYTIKYAFVTFDWAKNKDFQKYSVTGKKRRTVKNTEVQLILDDVKMGGGIYVLNNLENLDGIGNFGSLVGAICDFLK